MPEQREPWVMPAWMEPYRELISNTGGNPVEELMNDHSTTVRGNVVRAILIGAVASQVALFQQLHDKGWLVDLNDPALCGHCFHHCDLHTYQRSRATDTGDVPCVQCPAGRCVRPAGPEPRYPRLAPGSE